MKISHYSYDGRDLTPARHIHTYIENNILALAGEVNRYLDHEPGDLAVLWLQPRQFLHARAKDPYQQHLACGLQRPHGQPFTNLMHRLKKIPNQGVGCPALYLPSRGAIIALLGPPQDPGQLAAMTHALAEACVLHGNVVATPHVTAVKKKHGFWPNGWLHRKEKTSGLFDSSRAATLMAAQQVWRHRDAKPLNDQYLSRQWLIPRSIMHQMGNFKPSRSAELLPRLPYYRSLFY